MTALLTGLLEYSKLSVNKKDKKMPALPPRISCEEIYKLIENNKDLTEIFGKPRTAAPYLKYLNSISINKPVLSS